MRIKIFVDTMEGFQAACALIGSGSDFLGTVIQVSDLEKVNVDYSETPRDKFIAAALTGLIARNTFSLKECGAIAVECADSVMRQHDFFNFSKQDRNLDSSRRGGLYPAQQKCVSHVFFKDNNHSDLYCRNCNEPNPDQAVWYRAGGGSGGGA